MQALTIHTTMKVEGGGIRRKTAGEEKEKGGRREGAILFGRSGTAGSRRREIQTSQTSEVEGGAKDQKGVETTDREGRTAVTTVNYEGRCSGDGVPSGLEDH